MPTSFDHLGRRWLTGARAGTVPLVTPPRRSWLDRLRVFRRLDELECRMSATDDALADLNDATNDIATELDDLRGELTGADAAVADRITAAAERLRGLAADPENPVPEPTPEPTPEPGV
jgi:uncharacterized coiled-coil protein SlyX